MGEVGGVEDMEEEEDMSECTAGGVCVRHSTAKVNAWECEWERGWEWKTR